jgi:hypothetical protein
MMYDGCVDRGEPSCAYPNYKSSTVECTWAAQMGSLCMSLCSTLSLTFIFVCFFFVHSLSLSLDTHTHDSFEFSPEEVMAFCTDCVLADDDEPCDIPDAFYDELDRLKP